MTSNSSRRTLLAREISINGYSESVHRSLTRTSHFPLMGQEARRPPDTKLTPAEIQDLITATVQCQGKLAFVTTMLQIEKLGLDGTTRLPTK